MLELMVLLFCLQFLAPAEGKRRKRRAKRKDGEA